MLYRLAVNLHREVFPSLLLCHLQGADHLLQLFLPVFTVKSVADGYIVVWKQKIESVMLFEAMGIKEQTLETTT